MEEKMTVNGKAYKIQKLLGKGKGGYSYLVSDGAAQYVLKQIHHEPCSYYQFGNKMEAELRDYKRLQTIGIRMPLLFDVDMEQVKDMCARLYAAHINIDYFPTNFVVQNGILYRF